MGNALRIEDMADAYPVGTTPVLTTDPHIESAPEFHWKYSKTLNAAKIGKDPQYEFRTLCGIKPLTGCKRQHRALLHSAPEGKNEPYGNLLNSPHNLFARPGTARTYFLKLHGSVYTNTSHFAHLPMVLRYRDALR